jgi:uncharacterized membrane protein YheB (UPF0754 family)
MAYAWALIPLISACMGWFAAWTALKMLFHPQQPKKFLWVTLHGIFPKRQQQFAEKLGKLVSEELFSFHDIEERITHPDNVHTIMPLAEEHIDHFLRVKLPQQMPVIGMFIGDKTMQELKTVFTAELETLFPVIMKRYINNLEEELNLEKIITEKVATFPSDKVEQIFNSIMAKEFRFAKIIGGILGFVIGLLQVLLSFWQ